MKNGLPAWVVSEASVDQDHDNNKDGNDVNG